MILALGILSTIAIGTLSGILLAEAMYGGTSAPGRLLTEWADWLGRKVMGRCLSSGSV